MRGRWEISDRVPVVSLHSTTGYYLRTLTGWTLLAGMVAVSRRPRWILKSIEIVALELG